MLPAPLLSVYEEYKKDTNSVAAWLASNARAAGCPPSLLGDGPVTSARLKGRARKLAKSKQPSESTNKRIIPVNRFVPLAEYLTSQKNPAIPVPASVISAIERAITARAGFSMRLAREGEALDAEKNETHSHFVTVLKQTRDILRSKEKSLSVSTAASPPTFSSTSTKPTPEATNNNRFESLPISQPSEEFIEAIPTPRPEPAKNDPNIYEAEQQTSLQDALEVAFMLDKDLVFIRHQIVLTWCRFQDNFCDLPAAALASNTGLDLARFIIRQAEPIFEPHGGLVNFFKILHQAPATSLAGTWPDAAAIGGRFYSGATSTLSFCLSFVLNGDEDMVPTCLANYDSTASRDCMSDKEKLTDEFRLLGNVFVESVASNNFIEGSPVLDEFARETKIALESKQLTFFLVFAGQVILDINQHIRKNALKAFDKMQQELSSIEGIFDSHLKQISGEGGEIIPDLRDVLRILRAVKKDIVFECRQRFARENNLESTPPNERHLLYKLSPIACGLTVFHFRARLYEFGTHPNALGVVEDAAHLYQALYSEGMLNSEWQDLRAIEARLGTSAIFNLGSDMDRPSGTKAISKSLALQKGASLSALKKMMNSSNGWLRTSFPRRIRKTVESRSPLSTFFIDRFVYKSGRVDMRPEDVEKILSLSRFQSLHHSEEGLHFRIVGKSKTQGNDTKGASKRTTHSKLFPHILVKTLSDELSHESFIFAFPYMVVEDLCRELLLNLHTSCLRFAAQQTNPLGLGLPKSPEPLVLFILLRNLHEPPIGKDLYKLATDMFQSKLSTSWNRAGLSMLSDTWQLDMLSDPFSPDDLVKFRDRIRLHESRTAAVLKRVGVFSSFRPSAPESQEAA
ncbi:unnamed protein product [Clonostachys rosea]|uniref:DUF6604 domain-containing protein n=1 Tax=Bionectria ochroleuca TaxID=29856 RepID=A0ABY6UKS1_BIOOC|nr:unnamed protein product [Clonostachys rosea]